MSIQVFYNSTLSDITFYAVGGLADEVWEVDDISEFSDIWAETVAQKIPKVVLGKGSNIIFSDKGFRGRVFILKFEEIIWKGNLATVEAGKNFQDFIESSNRRGFADLCNLSGIPGNVGGFLRGNAGALGRAVSDFCVSVDHLDESGIMHTTPVDKCVFGYRESVFKHKPDWCIVRGTFKFNPIEGDISRGCFRAEQETKKILAERWKKNPPGRSGGCLFKNPSGNIAGKLLDECGAKGDRIGDAKISEKHANFFLNLDQAKQVEILELARKWKKIVLDKKGIELEPEVFICNEKGETIELS